MDLNDLEAESDHGSRAEDSDSEPDLISVFQYLIRRGHRFITYGSDSNDSDEMEYDDLRERFSRHKVPSSLPAPDTSMMDKSDFKQILLNKLGIPNESSFNKKDLPSVPKLLKNREVGFGDYTCRHLRTFSKRDRCRLSSHFLPNKMNVVDQYTSKAFCGFYSKQGDIFLTASQDTNIRLYHTKNGQFKLFKTVQARDVGWAILDADISPDQRHFAYSSWSECIHLCNIHGDHETHEALCLVPDDRRFCIFSLRFSQDGKEIIGGANDQCLYIYDRELNKRVLKIQSHEDDVNSVAFADSTSQILFSAADDGLCKVWDRRALNEKKPKPVGLLAGHIDGITYIDPKGDGRHLITNCKDQTIKLWDMRVFSPSIGFDATRKAVSKQNWDYRWQAVPRKLLINKKKIEGDTSLMTYRGHSVFQTLIRCHFSPEWSTGQRFIYTGCASGKVIIYDVLTGQAIRDLSGHRGCVRDVSWHPFDADIASTSWDGMITKWNYIDNSVFSSEDEDSDLISESFGLRRSRRLAEKRVAARRDTT